MTRMLVRAATAEDAFIAAAGGADVLEVWMPGPAPHRAAIRAIRAAFPGILRLRIDGPLRHPGAIEAAVSLGADEIALPFQFVAEARAALTALPPPGGSVKLTAIIPAEGDLLGPLELILGKADAAILDVSDGRRLVDAVTIAQLDAFGRACRLGELAFGLAGGLEAPDVARLLVLQPGLLGFDAAARRDHRAELGLDVKAVEALRALIPREDHSPARDDFAAHGETDHIFVHDFIVHLAIGAYQAERGARQRVRFSVDADVRRPAEPPTDMRGVFSYDIIIETIRVLAERPHVTFVETLAEELAANLLAYPQLTAVAIKVEKLDVIQGSVGIVVRRDRSTLVKPAGHTS
ncbi:MAG: dihydroneopterin aldolase [Beijerinckiaceae bacterium]